MMIIIIIIIIIIMIIIIILIIPVKVHRNINLEASLRGCRCYLFKLH